MFYVERCIRERSHVTWMSKSWWRQRSSRNNNVFNTKITRMESTMSGGKSEEYPMAWWCSKVDEISTIPVWFFLCVPFLLLQNEPILIVVAKYQRECMPIFIYDSLSMSRMHPLFNTCLSLSVCVCIYLCVSVYTFVTCFEFSFRCVRINCVKCYA